MPPISNSKYPEASAMPEMNTPAPGSPDAAKVAQQNPVMQALQTMSAWVQALEAKKEPGFDAIKSAFMQFVQAVQQSGGQGAGGPPPAPGAGSAAPAPGAPPGPPPGGPGANSTSPMNAAGNPNAKPMI